MLYQPSLRYLPVLDPLRIEVFASPDGDDFGDGTIQKPFRSIAFAIDYAKAAGIERITLRGGTYAVSAALSPRAGQTIRAYRDEKPIISGGVLVSGWAVTGDPTVIRAPRTHPYRQLYINGLKAILNRSAIGKTMHWWDVDGIPDDEIARQTGRGITVRTVDYQSAGSPGAGSIFVLQRDWADNYLPVLSATTTAEKTFIKFTPEAEKACFDLLNPRKHNPYSYHFENTPNLAEGCWRYDSNWIYYRLRAGETINSITAIAPFAETLIDVQSSDVSLEGLTFVHTNWFPELGKATFQADSQLYLGPKDPSLRAAVTARNCNNLQIRKCRFQKIGGNGLELGRGTSGALVEGNAFNGIAGGGLVMFGPRVKNPQYTAEHPELAVYLVDYVPTPPLADQCRNIEIRNNYFTNFAEEYYGSSAIFGAYINTYTIENNEIGTAPSYQITLGWGWRNLETCHANAQVKNNRLFNPFRRLTDGGAIYTLGAAPGSVISGNYCTGISANEDAWRAVCFLVYLDAGSKFWTVFGNVHGGLVAITGAGGGSNNPASRVDALFINVPLGDNNATESIPDTDPNAVTTIALAGISKHLYTIRG
jgi:hypothetical protein